MSTTEINHTDRAHSEIGASSASRWLNCPGSVALSRDVVESKDSAFAAEGTCAHECSEYCLENEVTAESCVGMEFHGIKVTSEMAGFVQYYVDNMNVYCNSDEYDTFVEERFELPTIHKDMFGSNDFCAMGIENGELVIADFKYGKGINVEAEENIQLIIYALGAYHDATFIYEFKTVKLIVVQPRIEGGEWSEWVISVDELLAYEDVLKDGIAKVYSANPELSPGVDQCRFCKAKPTCPALKAKAEDLIQSSFDDMPIEANPVLPTPESMDNSTIANIMKHSKLVEDWMKSVAAHAHNMLEGGEKIEGYKLVKKKSNRKIKSDKDLVDQFGATFGDELYNRKLKTMGALEKLIGKDEIAPFLYKPDAGNSVALATDKRPEVLPEVEQAFDEEPIETEKFEDMEF